MNIQLTPTVLEILKAGTEEEGSGTDIPTGDPGDVMVTSVACGSRHSLVLTGRYLHHRDNYGFYRRVVIELTSWWSKSLVSSSKNKISLRIILLLAVDM